MSEPTPVMKQYQRIKEAHSDAIVLFRMGDFYEMFGEDAKIAASILQIALTTREKGKEDPTPMCGMPYFAADSYIAKLVRAGHKVAVCEQTEDAKDVKGIVKREVVKVITPGTHSPDTPKENSYILSFFPKGERHGIAVADISTGEFRVFETDKTLEDELAGLDPREILYPESLGESIRYEDILKERYSTLMEEWKYDFPSAYKALLTHFRVASLEGFGLEGMPLAISAAGALVSYLDGLEDGGVKFRTIKAESESSFMALDAVTQRNLELIRPMSMRESRTDGTLLWALDETLTPMGGRFLRNAVLRPLIDIKEIRKRLDGVEYLVEDYELLEDLRAGLRHVQDIERLERRVSMGSANARDLSALKSSLSALPGIRKPLLKADDDRLSEIAGGISEFPSAIGIISKAIVDHPPISIRDGGIIRAGYSEEIDELRGISRSGKDFIARIEADERRKTGISSLKVGFNKVFGYYIEVTKPNLDLVPQSYIRKQTLVGAERFITPELKEYEAKVIGAEDRIKALELDAFKGVLEKVRADSEMMLASASAIAELDFMVSLSVVAKRHAYVKPKVTDGFGINIVEGRHPVLERIAERDRFIPNDTDINPDTNRLIIITGPNMAGKSTYMRQVALIVLMAQMGSFVPADKAEIGIADRIFTRIGASDAISRGQSTFMVEMLETANILNNATPKSLIVLDEIGRGTSTFDGISIAWAAAEYISKEIGARTLFATHYNELTELSRKLDTVRNYNVSVREWGDEIIFLRKINEGPADRSYGIQVARLAGLPEAVVEKAKAVLANLEKGELNELGMPRFDPYRAAGRRQLDLFAMKNDAVINEIRSAETGKLSPDEALELLKHLKEMLG